MKLLQIAFIIVIGATSLAAYVTSQTLHGADVVVEQSQGPAPVTS
ncbi:hypothetical protein [Yoonia sp.]